MLSLVLFFEKTTFFVQCNWEISISFLTALVLFLAKLKSSSFSKSHIPSSVFFSARENLFVEEMESLF